MEGTSVRAYTVEGRRWHHVPRLTYFDIFINDEKYFEVSIVPSHVKEFVMGYLVSNAYVEDPGSIEVIRVEDDRIKVVTTPDFDFRMKYFKEKGKEPLEMVNIPVLNGNFSISYEKMFEKLTLAGEQFYTLPSAIISDTNGYIFTSSDVRGENAFYKVIGRALMDKFDLRRSFLLLSYITLPEDIIRAAYMGIPVVGSTQGVTDLSVKVAENLGVTVFLLELDGPKIFTHPSRIR